MQFWEGFSLRPSRLARPLPARALGALTCTASAASIIGLRPQLRSMRADSTPVWKANGTRGRSASTAAAASLATRASVAVALPPAMPASTSASVAPLPSPTPLLAAVGLPPPPLGLLPLPPSRSSSGGAEAS